MNTLEINSLSNVKVSSDNRKYMTVGFQVYNDEDILSNAKERRRNIWQTGPNNSAGDAIFNHLVMENDEGTLVPKRSMIGKRVYGTIETIPTKPYYIPSPYGKFEDPETGEKANKVEQFTAVLFEGENIKSAARSQDVIPADEFSNDEVAQSAEEFNPIG